MLQGVVQTVGRLRKYCGTCDFFNRDHKSVRPKQGCSFSLLIFLNLFIITITLLFVCVWERETGTERQETMCGESYWMAPATVYMLSCVRVAQIKRMLSGLHCMGTNPVIYGATSQAISLSFYKLEQLPQSERLFSIRIAKTSIFIYPVILLRYSIGL